MGRVWQIEADMHAGLDAELLETGRGAVRKRVELSVGHALVHELQRRLVAKTRRRFLQHALQRGDVERDVRADAFRIGLDPRLNRHRLSSRFLTASSVGTAGGLSLSWRVRGEPSSAGACPERANGRCAPGFGVAGWGGATGPDQRSARREEVFLAMADGSKHPVCAVVGVGPGNGEAIARRFAADGYAVALMARRTELTAKLAAELPHAKAYACDVAEAASVEAAFAAMRADLGEVDALIYNAGSGVWGNVEEVKAEDLERSWRVNTLGLFLTAQQAIPAMRRKGQGQIIVVGATASRRGAAGAAAFAQSKMAQRALAESMARHLWPSGIHVALIVVDGVVGGPVTRSRVGDRPDDFFIDPAGVAAIAADLVKQDRSAWSFEVEARPFKEKW